MSKPTAVRTAKGEYMCSTRLRIVRESTSMSKPGKKVFVCDKCDCQPNLTSQRAYVEEDTEVKMTSEEAASFAVDKWLEDFGKDRPEIPEDLGKQICAAIGVDSQRPSCTNESARAE